MLHQLLRFVNLANRHESRLFWAWSLLHLLPVLLPAWFYTFDGPSHLHNSHLIGQLLFDKSEFLASWYQFNPNPEPNWLYYLFTVPLMQLFSPAWADKLTICLYVLVFAFGFRRFVLQLHHSLEGWLAWPVFFFVFHMNFFLGQYNFAFSMACLWWVLSYWLEILASKRSRAWWWLGIWLYLTYFSHLVGFLAAGLIMGILMLWPLLKQPKIYYRHFLGLLLLSMPLLLLSTLFFMQKSSSGGSVWLSYEILWQRLWSLEVIKAFNRQSETKALLALWLLAGGGLLIYIFRIKRQQSRHHLLWLAAAAMLLLYFLMPDQTAGAGYLSSRLALLCSMLLVLAGSLQFRRGRGWGVVMILLLAGQMHLLVYYCRAEIDLGRYMREYQEGHTHVRPGSVVQQLNYSPGWMHEHLTEGIFTKDVVHLANYEASNAYFPLRWRYEKHDAYYPSWSSMSAWPPCPDEDHFERLYNSPKQPDQLLRWWYTGPRAACDSALDSYLAENYRLTFTSSGGKLEIFTHKSLPEHAP
jgi:hypothetical protein